MTQKPLSSAMQSALQAVARMKGDSTIAWYEMLNEPSCDDRHAREPQETQADATIEAK